MKIVSITVLILLALLSESSLAQVPNFSWIDRIGSNGEDKFGGACIDPSGNVYVYGEIHPLDKLGIDTVYAEQKVFYPDKDHNHFIGSYDPRGNLRWVTFFSGYYLGLSGNRLICADSIGNIYFVVRGDDTLSIFDTVIYSNFHNNIIVKIDTAGELISANEIKGGHSQINSIKCDDQGNIYVCGYYEGETYFGYDTVIKSVNSDAFIAKYSNELNFEWINSVSSTVAMAWNDFSFSLDGTINLGGYFIGLILLGDEFIESQGSPDILVGRVFSDGSGGVSGVIGGKGNDRANFSATDGEGNSYIIGFFHDTVDFGGTELIAYNPDPISFHSFFFASFDLNGHLRWAKTIQPEKGKDVWGNGSWFESALVYPNGESILVGSFYGSAVFDSNGNSIHVEKDTMQAFLLKFDKQGDYRWLKYFPTRGFIGGFAPTLTASDNGNLYYIGTFSQFMQFDSTRMNALSHDKDPSPQDFDIAVSKLVFPPTKSVENIPLVENPDISVFPNPATERVTITYSADPGSQVTLLLKDVLGRQIATVFEGKSQIRENLVDWDVSALPSGTYIISLGVDGKTFNSLFKIQR